MDPKWFIFSLCVVFLGPVFGQSGTPGDPYTSLGHAWHVPSSGTYYFYVDGSSFSTYVESGSGWVLIASGQGSTSESAYGITSSLGLQSDQILPATIYASSSITAVRMNATSGPDLPLDVTSTDAGVISNVQGNTTLSVGTTSSAWSGSGTARVNPSCGSSSGPLSERIYHSGCVGTGLHWLLADGHERVNFSNSPNDLNLWVRADLVPLPVELQDFRAQVSTDGSVLLHWETTSEVNHDFFSLERSADGRVWGELGRVGGEGDSPEGQSYQFLDRWPNPGTSYYRLKQIDQDGGYQYSDLVSVLVQEASLPLWWLFPNPAIDRLEMKGKQPFQQGVRIFNALGKEVTQVVVVQHLSPERLVLEVSSLAPGMYFLHTELGSSRFLKR